MNKISFDDSLLQDLISRREIKAMESWDSSCNAIISRELQTWKSAGVFQLEIIVWFDVKAT